MYTVDYFIKKFEAIPEGLWLSRQYSNGDAGCVNYHCQKNGATGEFKAMQDMFNKNSELFAPFESCCGWFSQSINNGNDPNYQQPTPKQRILAALHDIKKKQQPAVQEVKEVIRYVSVDPVIKEMEVVLS